MKTLAPVAVVLSMLFSSPVFAHGDPGDSGASNAKATELAVHRIDRLVVLKKIDDSFQSKLQSLTVDQLVGKAATDPHFRVVASQIPAADGSQRKLELLLDDKGMEIQHYVTQAGASEKAPEWTSKDALTLLEYSLHFVIDNAETKPEIDTFNDGLTELTLASEKNAAGLAVPVVTMKAVGTKSTLRVILRQDGTVDTYEVRVPTALAASAE